ncbi:MAG: ABC transporter ATP-binding protein [Phycisphaerae bacterium]
MSVDLSAGENIGRLGLESNATCRQASSASAAGTHSAVADHRPQKLNSRTTPHCTVEVEGVSHSYGTHAALRDVTFSVARGSLFALLGPNGSGKTTLFKILATMLAPTAGRVVVAGADAATQAPAVRRNIGVVFQDPSLDRKLTLQENLTHQGHLQGLFGRELRERVASQAARFALTDRMSDRVEVLSGGLRRRVELAKALLHRPDVLILDEPGTGLDPAARRAFMESLKELRDVDGVTSLLTTHLLDEAECCDTVAILDGGRLVTLGEPAELKTMIGGDVLTIETAAPAMLVTKIEERFKVKAEEVDGGVRIELENGRELVPKLIEAFPGETGKVTVGPPTLEDVLVHLTGHQLRARLRNQTTAHAPDVHLQRLGSR